MNQINLIKQKTINQVVKEFIGGELYSQRITLIQLLLRSHENEYQYLAYLLYDLLNNNENNGHQVSKLSTETTNSTNDLETRLQVQMMTIIIRTNEI